MTTIHYMQRLLLLVLVLAPCILCTAIFLPSSYSTRSFTTAAAVASQGAYTQAVSDNELAANAAAGYSLVWVSQADRMTELIDPLEQLEKLQEEARSKDDDMIEVEVQADPFHTNALLGDYSWPASFDRIFDAESSSFGASSGSGWSDPAVEVQTELGLCRGQNQPGHLIYCVRPGARVDISALAKNTGVRAWTPDEMKLKMHLLDAAVWADPLATPMSLAMDADFHTQAAATAFTTQSAAADAYGHALSSTTAMNLLATSSGQAYVDVNQTALFGIAVQSPQAVGIYTLRFSPTSPYGRLSKPLVMHLEVTCSDGVFCNGYEKQVAGVCRPVNANPVAACDDGDSCTVDLCDETLGKCHYKLINSTACRNAVCGGERCTHSCAPGVQCGSDGCGGSCGVCQTGEVCTSAGQCTPSAQQAQTCFSPATLEVFSSHEHHHAWIADPTIFTRPGLPAQSPAPYSSLEYPSELSRQYLTISDVHTGSDEVTPSCISFGQRPDFIWRFEIPENAKVNRRMNATMPTEALQINLDPLSGAPLRREGYVGVSVQAYGKYNPAIDTVVEIRGAPGVFSTEESRAAVGQLHAVGAGITPLDPVYTCLDDRSKSLASDSIPHASDAPGSFQIASTTLEEARAWAMGAGNTSRGAAPERPLKPLVVCNDNNTPPGGLGSQLTALLPPGTYYLVISSYPRFNIPESVQTLLDAAAAEPQPGMTQEQSHVVEAFVRFTNGYLVDCVNTACGNDGGGNDCGVGCTAEEYCSAGGKCVAKQCKPDCGGRTCGSDGCGGVCGTCSLNKLSLSTLAGTMNPLGVPFAQEDVYCLEERDPSLELLNASPRLNHTLTAASSASSTSSISHLGRSSCVLMPRQCDGNRPVCFGVASGNGGALTAGCPSDTYCSNDCRCLPVSTPLPDLLVKFDALVGEITLSSYSFTNKSCSLVEKCIQRAGIRKLLRFSVAIVNQGGADLKLPKPREQPDDFVYSPCHHHYHYNHFADYALIQEGKVMQRGHKQAFCLEDSMQESIGGAIPCLAHHTCTQPGIQRGWSDYYGADLDCQWIDVTDLAPGKYILRVEVNSARELPEETFENNVLSVEVNIPEAPLVPKQIP